MVRIKKNNFIYNKSIYCCIAPGCQNIDNDTYSNVLFYIISENGLNQKPLTEFLENMPIRPKVSRICSEHFTDDCFQLHQGVKMLKPNAVPTIKSKTKPKSCTTRQDEFTFKGKEKQGKNELEQSIVTKDFQQQQSKEQQKQQQKQLLQQEHLTVCGHITFESCKNNFSFLCNFCQTNLEYVGAFKTHLTRLHINEIENKINSSEFTKTIQNERQKCGRILISSKCQNISQNCEFRFDCSFCNEKFKNIDDYSEHIGKSHLDLLEKDKESTDAFEEDIDIDPSCILSFDQISDIDERNSKTNTQTAQNNINNNKIVMTVPISDNSEIFMTIDINENENLTNTCNYSNNNNIHSNNNNNDNNSSSNINYNRQNTQNDNVTMADNLDKPKLKVNIKHSSWATRYY